MSDGASFKTRLKIAIAIAHGWVIGFMLGALCFAMVGWVWARMGDLPPGVIPLFVLLGFYASAAIMLGVVLFTLCFPAFVVHYSKPLIFGLAYLLPVLALLQGLEALGFALLLGLAVTPAAYVAETIFQRTIRSFMRRG